MRPGGVKSAERVLDVFELFRDTQRPMNGTEICEALGYPASSGNALLKSLVARGYLSVDATSLRYFPSLRLTHLGDWIPGRVMSHATTELLEDLHAQTSETVTLSMRTGLFMQFITVLPGTFPISLRITEGYMAPLFGSVIGTAALSTLPQKQVQRLTRRVGSTPGSLAPGLTLEAVLEEIEDVRARGYALAYDRVLPDTGAIAMPLPPMLAEQPLVIGVGGLSPRIRQSEAVLVRKMRASLRRLEQESSDNAA